MSGPAPPDFDVVVIGNAGIDTNVYLPDGSLDPTFETTFSLNLDCVGQAGAYSAKGFARLGLRVAFIGSVGDDPMGTWVLDDLARAGIDTSGVFVDPAGTARSVNLMAPDGRRRNCYDGKGHLDIEPDLDVCVPVLARSRHAHVHLAHWARLLLPEARQLGLSVSCDVQDVHDPDDPYRRDFVRQADVLFCSGADLPDPLAGVAELLERSSAHVVVAGLGAKGCLVATADGVMHHLPVELPDPVVDTNGAGDSLAVGFVTAHVLEGRTVDEAVLWGQLAARHACTLRGTSDALATRPQLLAWVASR